MTPAGPEDSSDAGMNPAEFQNIADAERELWWYRGMEESFYRVIEPFARNRCSIKVLEAGCGTGYMSMSLRRRFGWGMFPADFSATGLRFARRAGLSRLTQLDTRSLPFRSASFDAVVSLDVIAHLELAEAGRAFGEFARVLRPGGLLLLRTAALPALRSNHSRFVGERHRYTAPELRSLCEAAGLRNLRLTYLNALLLPVAFLKFRVWEPLTQAKPASGVGVPPPWLNSLLTIPLKAESAIVGAGINLPLGQSLLLVAERPTEPG